MGGIIRLQCVFFCQKEPNMWGHRNLPTDTCRDSWTDSYRRAGENVRLATALPFPFHGVLKTRSQPGETHYCLPVVKSESISFVLVQPWPLPLYPAGPLRWLVLLLPQGLHTECDMAPKQMKTCSFSFSLQQSGGEMSCDPFQCKQARESRVRGYKRFPVSTLTCSPWTKMLPVLHQHVSGDSLSSHTSVWLLPFYDVQTLNILSCKVCVIWIVCIRSSFISFGSHKLCKSQENVPQCPIYSCMRRCTHIHRPLSPFTFLTSHAQLAHAETCVIRYSWMRFCYCSVLFAAGYFYFSGWSYRTISRWWTTRIHLQFPRCFTVFSSVLSLLVD